MFGHVFCNELLTGFIAVNGLVLCTMVGEYPFNVIHPRDGDNIDDEDGYLNHTFHQVNHNIGCDVALHKAE